MMLWKGKLKLLLPELHLESSVWIWEVQNSLLMSNKKNPLGSDKYFLLCELTHSDIKLWFNCNL